MRTFSFSRLIPSLIIATGIIVVVAAYAVSSHAATTNANTLTFSRSVALPGVVLPAGTYVFDIANPDSSHAGHRVDEQAPRVRLIEDEVHPCRLAVGIRNRRELGELHGDDAVGRDRRRERIVASAWPGGHRRPTAGSACATRPSRWTLRGTLRSLRRRRWTLGWPLGEEWSHGDDCRQG